MTRTIAEAMCRYIDADATVVVCTRTDPSVTADQHHTRTALGGLAHPLSPA